MKRPAVFLDRDGVININRSDYVKTWHEFQFLPGVLDALQALGTLGWLTVVITNQSAIGRGLVTQETVEQIHQQMCAQIKQAGGVIHDVFYCPHHPSDGCPCRKPKPGLLHQAASCLEIDLSRSILVGDATSDIEAAQAVGCFPILVKTGRGLQQLSLLTEKKRREIVIANDLADAVIRILALAEQEQRWNQVSS
jgi:D-glycero-D-manno-heptose 1,7-bisphosphate phosphatase